MQHLVSKSLKNLVKDTVSHEVIKRCGDTFRLEITEKLSQIKHLVYISFKNILKCILLKLFKHFSQIQDLHLKTFKILLSATFSLKII